LNGEFRPETVFDTVAFAIVPSAKMVFSAPKTPAIALNSVAPLQSRSP
jgi:hypothetical protein